MSKISAKVILHSTHPDLGPEADVITIEGIFWRAILAETRTHRRASRNSASSRAISAKKMIKRVEEDPCWPISWPIEKKGMQGGDELSPEKQQRIFEILDNLRHNALLAVEEVVELGLHKSVANRYLEPWGWVTDIMTCTREGWRSIFALRCSKNAQPEFRVYAEACREAIANSAPQLLTYDIWHLPYVTGYDLTEIAEEYGLNNYMEYAKKISAARCARVSYLTHDGIRDWDKDLQLFQDLKHPPFGGPPHASPWEHVCTPARYSDWMAGDVQGNLEFWRQFRHDIERELKNERS
jgi:hypothetical protein